MACKTHIFIFIALGFLSLTVAGEPWNITGIIKNDFLISEDTTASIEQMRPSIAMDGAGNFIVVWEDSRNRINDTIPNVDIYVQRIDSNGNFLGSNFKVNDEQDSSNQLHPSVAMNKNGDCVVVMEDYRDYGSVHLGPDIYAQRIDKQGNLIGANFRVSYSKFGGCFPSVAISANGDFIVVWEEPTRSPDIFGQRVDRNGNLVETSFWIAGTPVDFEYAFEPTVAMDSMGNALVVWYEYAGIYAQRIDTAGNFMGPKFKVSDESGCGYNPVLAMDKDGNSVVV